jgi:hypothetical protein
MAQWGIVIDAPFQKFAIDLFPSRASEALRPEQLTNFRVSNILRMIGAYLDAGEHELVEIQKRPIAIHCRSGM